MKEKTQSKKRQALASAAPVQLALTKESQVSVPKSQNSFEQDSMVDENQASESGTSSIPDKGIVTFTMKL